MAGDPRRRKPDHVEMNGLAKLPSRRTGFRVAAAALVVSAICWFFGADVWHSLLFGTVLTAVGLVGLYGLGVEIGTATWRAAGSNREGARRDVDQLSWSMRGSYGRVDTAAIWRVQRLAQQRLTLHHLDLQNPADRPRIQQLLGRRAYVVIARGERRPVSLRALLHCLDTLDALDALDPLDVARLAPPLSRRRRLTLIPHRLRRTT
jgi:hypothetical protein